MDAFCNRPSHIPMLYSHCETAIDCSKGVNLLYESEGSCEALTVPALLTRGSAKHWSPPAHGVEMNFPPTHCENAPLTQADWPSVHVEAAVRVANCAFSFWASRPFSIKVRASGVFGSDLLGAHVSTHEV